MKIQDAIFIITLAFLIYKRDRRLFTIFGILCLFLSIPLFSRWVFFTAERLTWYAGTFFLASILINILQLKSNK